MNIILKSALASTSVLMLLAASACGSGDDGSAGDAEGSVSVVASTNVWGDVARQVAGDRAGSEVRISSIIANPDADPHSYEADTRTQLALSRADLVIENGGGYDDFVEKMLKGGDNDDATVLDAVAISGKKATTGEELNEHVWYDLPTVQKVADRIAAELGRVDPDHKATYAANAKAFDARLTQLEGTEAAIKSAHTGEGVAITEPVPLYLLEACGLVNKTPEQFSEAIEEGDDVPAKVLQQTKELFTGKQVGLLAYNEQTSGPETEAVLDAADQSGVAVVPVTETLPKGKDYLTWMGDNLAAVQKALG